jgi:cyclopropane fatty-acyl-phospholipid synthase-like methyltransferase
MGRITADEKKVRKYYDYLWSKSARWQVCDETLGFHAGFFEQGIRTIKEAVLNMNEFVGRLLTLDDEKPMEILDAGCGVGGTPIYLAQKYPNIRFTGITISPVEVKSARKFAKKRNISDITFLLGNYLETGFPDNSFDGVFALESMEYARDKKDFVKEMHRILKPGGKIAVVGGFRTDIPLHSFTRKLYDLYCKERGNPDLPNINLFKSYLEMEGFREINIMNLHKNLRRYVLILFFDQLPVFLSSIITGDKKLRDPRSRGGIGYFLGAVVLDVFFGASKMIRYNAITAVKK